MLTIEFIDGSEDCRFKAKVLAFILGHDHITLRSRCKAEGKDVCVLLKLTGVGVKRGVKLASKVASKKIVIE